MVLEGKLYPEKKLKYPIREAFSFLNPNLQELRSKMVKKGDRKTYLEKLQINFFPGLGYMEVEEEYKKAINRGIEAVNSLSKTHLPKETFEKVKLSSLEKPPFNFLKDVRKEWLGVKKHNIDITPENLRPIYSKILSHGLGYIISLIETSGGVINSLRNEKGILDWFSNQFHFFRGEEISSGEHTHLWKTRVVDLYGSKDSAFQSRLKVFDRETGGIKYDSVFMKLLNKKIYPGQIKDYMGVEFLVKNEDARKKLLSHFYNIKAGTKLENFKQKIIGKKSINFHSLNNFGFTKFVLRPPLPVEPVYGHPLGENICVRFPVEVQILTLEDDKMRREDPEAQHEKYKEEQFRSVFPLLFPREFYGELVE